MPTLVLSDHLKHVFGQQFTEMDISYSGVGLNQQKSSVGKLKSGERAPALWVKHLPDCTSVNLLDLYDGSFWTVLVMAPAEPTETSRQLIRYALQKQTDFPRAVRAVALSTGPKRPSSLSIDTFVDAEFRFARDNDLPETLLLLVRPDGYIAWVGENPNQDLDSYLIQWLDSRSQ